MEGYYINEEILDAILTEKYQQEGLFEWYGESTIRDYSGRMAKDLIKILDEYHYGDE